MAAAVFLPRHLRQEMRISKSDYRLISSWIDIACVRRKRVGLIQEKVQDDVFKQLWLLELDVVSRPGYVIDFQIWQRFPIVDGTIPRQIIAFRIEQNRRGMVLAQSRVRITLRVLRVWDNFL